MRRTLLLVLALYLVVRGLAVAAMGDVFIYGEELEKGFVARALLDGVDVPYARLPYHPYEGGGFVASHLKAVAFSVMGSSLLAHKVCALLWGALVVAATVALLHRHAGGGAAGRSAGTLGGVLLCFGPAHFQKESLLHLGIHHEALLFIALVLHLGLVAAAPARGERVRAGVLIPLGLAAGFGTYFSYQVPLAVLAVAGLLAVRDPRRVVALPLVAATLVGLAPLGLMALAVGAEVMDVHGESVGGTGGFGRLLASLRHGLSPGLAVGSLLVGAAAAVAGSFASPPDRGRKRAALLLLGFGGLWCVAAGATGMLHVAAEGHWFQLVRAAPLVWTGLVLVALLAGPALALEGLARGEPAAKVARSSAALLIGIGAVHTARIVDEGQLGRFRENLTFLASVRGDDPRGALVKIAPRLLPEGRPRPAASYAEVVEAFLAVQVEPRVPFVTDVVAGVTLTAGEDPAVLTQVLAARMAGGEAGAELSGAALRGLGAPLFHHTFGPQVRESLGAPELGADEAEALGRYGPGWYGPPALADELATAVGRPRGADYLRGVGARAFRTAVMQPYWGAALMLRPGAVRVVLEDGAAAAELSEVEAAALLEGFDREAAVFGVPDPTWPGPGRGVDSAR